MKKKKESRSKKPRSHIHVRAVNAEKYIQYTLVQIPKKKRKGCNSSTYSIWQAYRFVPKEPVQDFPLLLLLLSSSLRLLYLTYLTYTYLGGTCNMGGALFSCMC